MFQLHAFAFGVLGWTPYDYYTSSPYEFFAACEGYSIKREHEAAILRTGFYRLHQSLLTKPLPLEEFWPLFGDKANRSSGGGRVMSKEQWERIKTIKTNVKELYG